MPGSVTPSRRCSGSAASLFRSATRLAICSSVGGIIGWSFGGCDASAQPRTPQTEGCRACRGLTSSSRARQLNHSTLMEAQMKGTHELSQRHTQRGPTSLLRGRRATTSGHPFVAQATQAERRLHTHHTDYWGQRPRDGRGTTSVTSLVTSHKRPESKHLRGREAERAGEQDLQDLPRSPRARAARGWRPEDAAAGGRWR
eukprot:scaffold19200_cov60-Phaeocystis_antarctica.AAC.5